MIKKIMILALVLFVVGCAQGNEVSDYDDGEEHDEDGDHITGITVGELSAHSSADDCWIVYEGQVYDMTQASQHPKMGDTLLEDCGTIKGFEEGAKTQHGDKSNSNRVSSFAVFVGDLE